MAYYDLALMEFLKRLTVLVDRMIELVEQKLPPR